jgi:glycosyltransferase involved in cell wall biosynthesis
MMIFIGEGSDKSHLIELTTMLGLDKKVLFMGKRNDVSDFYNIFNVFLLPSLSEGMSNTILEAMASGVAVIASAVGGNTELVIDNKTGFLFQSNCVEDLVRKIKYYLVHPELLEKHGRKGRKRVLENYTIDQMVQGYETVYLEVIRDKLNSNRLGANKNTRLKI